MWWVISGPFAACAIIGLRIADKEPETNLLPYFSKETETVFKG